MAAASATAPAAFSAPAPCVRVSSLAIGNALYCSIALTAFGVSLTPGWFVRLASSINDTTPLTTPAAMLVPLSFMRAIGPSVLISPPG